MESKINERMTDLDAIFQVKLESKINERINDLDAKYTIVQQKNMVCNCFYRHGQNKLNSNSNNFTTVSVPPVLDMNSIILVLSNFTHCRKRLITV